MKYIRPLSTPHGADYRGALPKLTEEECTPFGVNMAVGFPGNAIVYRSTWDKNGQTNHWQYLYTEI